MIHHLKAMGAEILEEDGDLIIIGGHQLHSPTAETGSAIDTNGDVNIAMSFAIAALALNGNTTIDDSHCLSDTYSNFFRCLTTLS